MKKVIFSGLPSPTKLDLILSVKKYLESTGHSVIRFANDEGRKMFRWYAFGKYGRIPQGIGTLKEPDGTIPDFILYDFTDPSEAEKSVANADHIIWVDVIEPDVPMKDIQKYEPPMSFDFRITEYDAPKWAPIIGEYISK